MALRITRRERVLVARSVHPEYRQVLSTYVRHQGVHVEEVPFANSGQIEISRLEAALKDQTAAVVIQSPNFFGALEKPPGIAEMVHRAGALLIMVINEPLSLAIVRPPYDADIVCGEAQSFGVPVAFGGPYLGFLAAKEQFIRQMPGRLVGQTTDTQGRRGFVLTLATREQHIRREKATSNICTNQSLCALAATIYLSLFGKRGLKALAEQNLAKAHYAANQLAAVPGVALPFDSPRFNEFVVRTEADAGTILDALLDEKIIGGLNLESFYPELKKHILVCATELTSKSAMDRMAEVYRRMLPSSTDSTKSSVSQKDFAAKSSGF